jgi:hypothetical protein
LPSFSNGSDMLQSSAGMTKLVPPFGSRFMKDFDSF